MLLLRQIDILTWKNILIALVRHPITTPLRAFFLPVIFAWFLSYARNLFIPPSLYGIGSPTEVLSLRDAYSGSNGGRSILAFVNNGLVGGDVAKVIANLSSIAESAGKQVEHLEGVDDLLTVCRSSLRGSSNCVAAVVFYSSPTEGDGGIWNYSIRADGSLGEKIVVNSASNDQEIYLLPLQHATDWAIAGLDPDVDTATLPEVEEYTFTSETPAERNTNIRVRYMGGIISILGVAFFIGICGILYQQVGAQAVEREIKMAQLLECMMPNRRRWEPQVARLASYHLAFTIIYLPGWIIIAVIFQKGVFQNTSMGILLVLHFLTGLSLASTSLFIAAFFKKSQLSGITSIIVALLLAVLAQVYNSAGTAAVAVLSLLFPSMNYTYFIILMARWEKQNRGTNLIKSAPDNPWSVPGIVLWIFLIIQIVVYPVLGAIVERSLWGTGSSGRKVMTGDAEETVKLTAFTKHYYPTWFNTSVASKFGKKKKEMVVAVDALDLKVLPGQIMVLLGANGSGKSTTLDAIAGLSTVTSGLIEVDARHGIGLCPQQNVLWKELTVYEHVNIFNVIKETDKLATRAEKEQLIRECDLDRKITARASSLSGGQMRKLQLSLMFTGGSRVCLIDECSSGVDAIARRKLQDILLSERTRSNRTMIFTTHFLDEADLLSDYIVIMSKGKLRVEGTAPEIKNSLGRYRIHLYHNPTSKPSPDFPGIEKKEMYDQTVYNVPDSAQTTELLSELENEGWKEYQVSGPTIEDAFMTVAEEMVQEGQKVETMPAITRTETSASDEKASDAASSKKELQLRTGTKISAFRQGLVLFRKRATVFRRNALPNLAALLIPIIAAGLVTLFIKHFPGAGCIPSDQVSSFDINSLISQITFDLVIGPSSRFTADSIGLIEASLPIGNSGTPLVNMSTLTSSIHMVDTLVEFNDYINQNFANVTPGGFFLGENGSPAILAYQGDTDVSAASITQNLLDIFLLNTSIASSYQSFDIPWQADQGSTLQFCVYFGLALAIYPAFFSLYPCVERLRNVRALHYSNGIRALPLWSSYAIFDFLFVFAGSVVSIIILRATTDVFYGPGYLFVVFFLYGLTSMLGSYVISLFVKSQLAAFAFAAGTQAVMFLLYIIAYLSVFTYSQVNKIDGNLLIVHFVMAAFFPTGSLIRALFVSLNIFSIICVGETVATYPGGFDYYGGPILYLIIQAIFLFVFLVWWDSGSRLGSLFRRKTYRESDTEEKDVEEDEITTELERVKTSNDDGLRVLHLTKAYGKNVAVENLSFGVRRGEVFALLGPNGAGKSTTISVIRGDIRPSNNGGEVYIEDVPLSKKRATARQHLGVCPQFDAMDQLTVLEHLRFYARIRGVKEVEHNVQEVLRAVGLAAFQTRMGNSLSGGNKRKLSLGIALSGNPSVMLLDEVSSGMDVAAKRIMWRTLASIVPGRSIVLTTHSMEEADALATRAGIMARKMLALGTSDYLRKKHGDRYHIHLLLKSAPYTSTEEVERVKAWIESAFEGMKIEGGAHGQVRFSVPATIVSTASATENKPGAAIGVLDTSGNGQDDAITRDGTKVQTIGRSGIATLFQKLEASKQQMGFEYYSVSQTTLDQVFLSIVSKHDVEEEGYAAREASGKQKTHFWTWKRSK